MKITNIVVSPTEYTEDLEWSSVLAYKIKLLQHSDWILQVGSGVLKQHKWLQWRESLRKCNRKSFSSPAELQTKIEELDKLMPRVQRYTDVDTSDLIFFKDIVLRLVKYYYSKKLDIEINSYFGNVLLLDERYKEALEYQKTKKLDRCYFIQNYMELTGKSVNDAVQYFLNEKEKYFLVLLRYQKEMEQKIKIVLETQDTLILKQLYEDYNIWISTLTLTPVQI
jgi:hypothetical protein